LLTKALSQLRSAIELLDRAEVPGHIAAHADMAMNGLQRELSTDGARTPDPFELNRERYETN
jgi:hypothetical protein